MQELSLYRKNNDWRAEFYFAGDEVYFASVNLTLSLADIYDGILFDESF